MTSAEFIRQFRMAPEEIDADACMKALLADLESGLSGKGPLPMIPSYLPLGIRPRFGEECCVLDAGGTNLRAARCVFSGPGDCRFREITKTAMPGTQGELTAREFYAELARYVQGTGCTERIGFCFSYNVLLERDLDGILEAWCKEVRVPDAPGKPVGASLQEAVGLDCGPVRVLNDSTAALLGANFRDPEATVALILGTGINTCYEERCSRIPKLADRDLEGTMIISTEIGEFRGFPKTIFEEAVIAGSDAPQLAHAEKQCAGAYLGQVICKVWQKAHERGIIPGIFAQAYTLPQISDYLAGSSTVIPENADARELAQVQIRRAARIAAILTAATVVRSAPESGRCTLVVEGSQFSRLTGFGPAFLAELHGVLEDYGICISVMESDNSCMTGAALAAFAQPM